MRKGKNNVSMMLRVNLPAETVERIIGLKSTGASLDTKMHTDLSTETTGYAWATVSAIRNANADGVIKVGPTVSVQLRDPKRTKEAVAKIV